MSKKMLSEELNDMLKVILAESLVNRICEEDDEMRDEDEPDYDPKLARRIQAGRRLKALRVKKGLDKGTEGLAPGMARKSNDERPKALVRKKPENFGASGRARRTSAGPLGHSRMNTLEPQKKAGHSPKFNKGGLTSPMSRDQINQARSNPSDIETKTSAGEGAFSKLAAGLQKSEPSKDVLRQKMIRRKVLARKLASMRRGS